MKNSISDVLETMFFLPLDVCDTANPEELINFETENILASKLTFKGPFSGHLVFLIPEELAFSLTANFLGKNEDRVSNDHVTETVKEIINMIAGNTFSIFNPRAVFDLDIPKLVRSENLRRDHSDSEQDIFVVIDTLENRLALQMVIGS